MPLHLQPILNYFPNPVFAHFSQCKGLDPVRFLAENCTQVHPGLQLFLCPIEIMWSFFVFVFVEEQHSSSQPTKPLRGSLPSQWWSPCSKRKGTVQLFCCSYGEAGWEEWVQGASFQHSPRASFPAHPSSPHSIGHAL